MRPPEVFVRELSPQEGARLKSISKRARYQAKRQRAMIVLASATLMSAPEIARLIRTDEWHVRKVIQAFREEGFEVMNGGEAAEYVHSITLESGRPSPLTARADSVAHPLKDRRRDGRLVQRRRNSRVSSFLVWAVCRG